MPISKFHFISSSSIPDRSRQIRAVSRNRLDSCKRGKKEGCLPPPRAPILKQRRSPFYEMKCVLNTSYCYFCKNLTREIDREESRQAPQDWILSAIVEGPAVI